MNDRRSILAALVNFAEPARILGEAVASLGRDFAEEIAILTPDHISSVLQRFLRGEIAAKDVEDWANLVEGRDDVGFSPHCEVLVRDVLHELANPLLTTPLTTSRAANLIALIERASKN